jgi:hypothetical protein
MDHVTDEQLQSHLDGEDSEFERVRTGRHLEACAPCRARLEELGGLAADVGGALALLRPPAGARPAFDVLADRARAVRPVTARPGAARATASARPWLRAAVVLLALAGAAGAATVLLRPPAAALPEAAVTAAPAEPAAVAPGDEGQAALRSGVSVLPEAGRVVVAVRGVAVGSSIDVVRTASPEASAFVRGDGAGVRFSARSGRLEVDAGGRVVALEIALPEAAVAATVEVDGRVRARTEAGGVRIVPVPGGVSVRAPADR